ncbi:alpha/beta fold hydrolase [Marinactinospora thermotolerans]|uniref:Pimeloyl-ACP methyl ester carboxylesterase n=1 Tax=Marinactinospora thermotolerans DSM 45154 TaxID=1122192 RepID=A0A1T4NSJ6_9ACTN|nr:alpha/beta hydrolase [Marinactinospora thermotolerans]SJZ82233.1 Pimeloyl-ACP methyl ester carboxylesterase [Marinactinospora thermotolerans DSM 45154]
MSHDLVPGAERLTLRRGLLTFDALAAGPEDGPLVLFLHGFPEFATSWRAQLLSVADAGYRAVAVDQRGYSPGARPGDVRDYVVSELLDDLFGFADELGAERFHLVGHDWGGVLCWPAAARRPERLISLTVLATPHPQALTEVSAASEEQRGRLAYIRLFRTEGKAEEVLLADDAARLRAIYEGRVPAELVEDNVRRLSRPGALTAALSWYRALDSGDAEVPAITVPTLYVWGEHDLAFTAQAAEATAAWVSAPYSYLPLTGASHWLPEEDPARVTGPLLEHLATHS